MPNFMLLSIGNCGYEPDVLAALGFEDMSYEEFLTSLHETVQVLKWENESVLLDPHLDRLLKELQADQFDRITVGYLEAPKVSRYLAVSIKSERGIL